MRPGKSVPGMTPSWRSRSATLAGDSGGARNAQVGHGGAARAAVEAVSRGGVDEGSGEVAGKGQGSLAGVAAQVTAKVVVTDRYAGRVSGHVVVTQGIAL